MPNRYIRESAIESERVNALSWHGEVFYRRLLNRVDDFGRYSANESLLRASIFPLQVDKVSTKDVTRLLKECQQVGLLFAYEVENKRFLVINQWEKGRAKKSLYPSPPANICEHMKTHVYTCKHMSTDVPDSDSDSDTDTEREGAPKSKKGKPESPDQVKAFASENSLPVHLADSYWDHFESNGWKVGGRSAMKSWQAAFRNWCRREPGFSGKPQQSTLELPKL